MIDVEIIKLLLNLLIVFFFQRDAKEVAVFQNFEMEGRLRYLKKLGDERLDFIDACALCMPTLDFTSG